ncbi:hypothetical protein vseg_000175 [Gypsophila vaccaria]
MEKFEGINSIVNLKRKNFEEFNHDFWSPAHKIRRLNAKLPPIVGEDDTDLTMRYEEVIPGNVSLDGVGDRDRLKMADVEELSRSLPENEERAIVLFNPMNSPLSNPVGSFSVDPTLIANLKRQVLHSVDVNTSEHSEKDDDLAYRDAEGVNACRAVVPWAPSYNPCLKSEVPGSQIQVSEFDAMDAEEPEIATMDIEDHGASDLGQQATDYYRLTPQWQQTHCMFPQPPQNTATPVVWYR